MRGGLRILSAHTSVTRPYSLDLFAGTSRRCPRWSLAASPTLRLRAGAARSASSSARHETLTLLHKTTSILPIAIAESTQRKRLDALLKDISEELSLLASTTQSARPKVSFYVADRNAGSEDVVSALLEDPFTSAGDAFQRRWNDRKSDVLQYRYASSFSMDNDLVNIPSPWLQRQDADLLECRLGQDLEFPFLTTADIPIIVANPLIAPWTPAFLASLLSDSPNGILVLTGVRYNRQIAKDMLDDYASTYPKLQPLRTRIMFVDPGLAIRALDALRADPSSPSAIQRYQDYWSASGIGAVSETILRIFDAKTAEDLRIETSQAALRATLNSCLESVMSSERQLQPLRYRVDALHTQLNKRSAAIQEEIIGHEPVRRAKETMENKREDANEKITFWTLPLIVDDLSSIMSKIMYESWTKELEAEMMYQAGRLAFLQSEFVNKTADIVKSVPQALGSHAVLENTLAQIASSPTNAITPETLIKPIHERLRQLSYPKLRFQITAQRSLFSFIGTAVTSVAGASCAWAGFLGAWAEIGGPTAFGVGVLGSLIGLRWAMAKWHRGQRRAGEDWHRIGEGMERDVRSTVEEVIREKVAAVPNAARKHLTEMIKAKSAEIEGIEGELRELTKELERTMEKTETKSIQ